MFHEMEIVQTCTRTWRWCTYYCSIHTYLHVPCRVCVMYRHVKQFSMTDRSYQILEILEIDNFSKFSAKTFLARFIQSTPALHVHHPVPLCTNAPPPNHVNIRTDKREEKKIYTQQQYHGNRDAISTTATIIETCYTTSHGCYHHQSPRPNNRHTIPCVARTVPRIVGGATFRRNN